MKSPLRRSDHGALLNSVEETAARLGRRPKPAFTPIHPEISVSFEFFPPATEVGDEALWACIRRLAPFKPRFASVTFGAGGTTRTRTHDTVRRIRNETGLHAAAHLTCVGASRCEVDSIIRDYHDSGVRHIVALRGDPPNGAARFAPHPQGYQNSAELVSAIRRIADFEVSVGAYPEVHPDAASPAADLDNLKRKVDAGASRAVTQFFFDPDVYLRFLDRARAAGINVPIVPGILPVTNFARVSTFAKRCGATVPPWMGQLFEGLDEVPEVRQLVAATVAAEQCCRLGEAGVREFHFYTLNRAELSHAICHILGLRPSEPYAPTEPRPLLSQG